MNDSFLFNTVLSLISTTASLILLVSGIASLCQKNNFKKSSCVYYFFFSLFYLLYNLLSWSGSYIYDIESGIVYMLPVTTIMFAITAILFVNLFECAYIQEEIENRVITKNYTDSINRQKTLKSTTRVFYALCYLTFLAIFAIIALNSFILEHTYILFIAFVFTILVSFIMSCITYHKSRTEKHKRIHCIILIFMLFSFFRLIAYVLYSKVMIQLVFESEFTRWIVYYILVSLRAAFSILSAIAVVSLAIQKWRKIK